VSRYTLGIDLGTLTSCVAVVQDGRAVVLTENGRSTVPSAVSLLGDRELVGEPARRRALTDPKSTFIATKRIIGHPFDSREVKLALERMRYPIAPSPVGSVVFPADGREMTPVQVATRILYHLKETAEAALEETVKRAVISVPAHFNEVQRRATKLAAEYAGLDVLRLINEPTAAAFAYGYRRGEDFSLAVYDLGGGTFDVTIMWARGDCFDVVATDGDAYLGGEDFDQAIVEWLAKEFAKDHGTDLEADEGALIQLKEAAERAKLDLSEVEETRIELPYLLKLNDSDYAGLQRTLTRENLNELTAPLVQCSLDLCARCLSSSGVRREDLDAVLLVGGQTRMPAVRDAVRDFFGLEPRRDINPDEVVAMGAALYGYSLQAKQLRANAEDAAEEAFAVALKRTTQAKKIVEAVEALEVDTKSEVDLAKTLSRVMAEAEAQNPGPIDADADLPAAVEGLREEMYSLQEKIARVSDGEEGESSAKEKPKPIAEAVEVVVDWLSRAEEASDVAQSRLQEAEEHGRARKVELTDVTSHALGIAAVGDLLTVLIDKNTSVPAEKTRRFTTHQDNQTEVQIRVFQGENPQASENELLGDFVLTGIEPAARLTAKIEVVFRLDEDGILAVQAQDVLTGAAQGITVKEPLGLREMDPETAAEVQAAAEAQAPTDSGDEIPELG
jgi:molecular chaperone DnaK (HSP70)